MRIESYNNWCDIDCYGSPATSNNGFPKNAVSDGDKVVLVWPSGRREPTTISVVKSRRTVSDMGTPYDMPVHKAYVTFGHEGTKITTLLTDLKLEIEKVD